ncbi:hypothetical protein G4B88_003853 [Cannabis sativa]|uniref:Uncharacterized protein n=1 Tax=Cannabis sativa TaxID=3483 RepID=A0A7J6FKZ9_CANSA|nr:hypothetical protein G4B88_003853 [Cannabis sativa]
MLDKGENGKAIEPEMRQNEVESESDDNSDDIYSDEDDCHEFNAMKAISNVAKFVCSTEVDPRIVSSDSFTGFMKLLNPHFELDYTAVQTECVAIFLKEKSKIMEILGNFDGEISVSVREMGMTKSFVLVSLHFIDENWSLKNWNAFEEVEGITDKIRCLYNPKSEPLWYLTSSKLKDAIELWSMGEFSSENVTDYSDVPTVEEWNRVEQVCNIVESIYKVAYGIFHKQLLLSLLYVQQDIIEKFENFIKNFSKYNRRLSIIH